MLLGGRSAVRLAAAGTAMRSTAAMRLAMSATLIMMVLGKSGRSHDETDNCGRDEEFAHQVHLRNANA